MTFLVKATSGREAVMRLPVGKYEAMTPKGLKMIRARFYDGSTGISHSLAYALNLETFSNADSLIEALNRYKKNHI